MLKTRDCICPTGDKLEQACRDLLRERDKLRAENERLLGMADRQAELILQLERGGYKQDAERYRFLCELNENEPNKFYEFPDAYGWSKQEIDKLVDALRGEGSEAK